MLLIKIISAGEGYIAIGGVGVYSALGLERFSGNDNATFLQIKGRAFKGKSKLYKYSSRIVKDQHTYIHEVMIVGIVRVIKK